MSTHPLLVFHVGLYVFCQGVSCVAAPDLPGTDRCQRSGLVAFFHLGCTLLFPCSPPTLVVSYSTQYLVAIEDQTHLISYEHGYQQPSSELSPIGPTALFPTRLTANECSITMFVSRAPSLLV